VRENQFLRADSEPKPVTEAQWILFVFIVSAGWFVLGMNVGAQYIMGARRKMRKTCPFGPACLVCSAYYSATLTNYHARELHSDNGRYGYVSVS
jgi:hypothetical protein